MEPKRIHSWKLFSSVQFSCSVMSDSSRPHESQHARPPCPSPTPRVHSDSRPWSRWYHPAISSSVVSFSSCPQSLPASESFPMSQLFAWGGQSIGVSASASVLPKNTQDWSPLDDSNILCCWLSGLPSLRKCLVDFLTVLMMPTHEYQRCMKEYRKKLFYEMWMRKQFLISITTTISPQVNRLNSPPLFVLYIPIKGPSLFLCSYLLFFPHFHLHYSLILYITSYIIWLYYK